MSGRLRLVLGDQLSPTLASLRDADPQRDLILMAEVGAEATYVRHHKKKIAFLFSAMRHFAAELEAQGLRVRYVRLDDPANTQSLEGEVARALAEESDLSGIVLTRSGEWRLEREIDTWPARFQCPVERREDDRFLCTTARFESWAEGRSQLRMEYFYRDMRRATGILMHGDQPVGGQWNYDQENRKALPKGAIAPPRLTVEPDAVTRAVMDLVASRFGNHFGDLEPFFYAVTRPDAERLFEAFATDILPGFGDHQDAMAKGEPWLWHGVIGLYLNCGLLHPLAVCQRAERAYREGFAPLNAVEGFIRQILGWREYVRGLYWLKMPDYKNLNALDADRRLPDLYWTADTPMVCMADAIGQTKRHAYAHHIQRLMVTGNFALLAGLHPDGINDWYLSVYADAYEWVELPNTHGMAIYADGGIMASKPYAASGAYISRMSDYCSTCRYDPKLATGPRACPFTTLYWDFLARHRERFSGNARMALAVKNVDRKSPQELAAIRTQAEAFLDSIGAVRESTP
jgi:deoxyribodipyrimidine photolyase-related protein